MRDFDDNAAERAAEKANNDPSTSGRRQSGAAVALLLLAILAAAALLRMHGIGWDEGTHLHPDERHLTIVASGISGVDNPLDYLRTSVSTLNPANIGERFYVYGNFPMTVTRYAGESAAGLCEWATERGGERPGWCGRNYAGYDGIHLVGRFLSAMVDVLTVLFTFLIGRRLYGRWAGLFAALLMALAVMPIQQSHFFTMDNWATMFTTAAVYAAIRAATLGDAEPRFRWQWWAAFGLFVGLAMASRINMAPLALVVNLSALIWLARTRRYGLVARGIDPDSAEARPLRLQSRYVYLAVLGVALAAAATIFTFRLAQPYAFADARMIRETALAETGREPNALLVAVKSIIYPNPLFLENMGSIQVQQAPEAAAPPAVQWTDRPAILFPLSNMILYGMGITAGVFAWGALLWALWRIVQTNTRYEIRDTKEVGDSFVLRSPQVESHSPAAVGSTDTTQQPGTPVSRISYLVSREWMLHAIPAIWTAVFFLYMGTRWVKSIRYFLPIYPTLFVLAGWAIVYLWQRARARDDSAERKPGGGGAVPWRGLVGVLAALIILPSLLWAVTFTRIYREPMTRVAASRWIYENVPSGATLLYDTADGVTAELNLPLKGAQFDFLGVPHNIDITMPAGGVIRALRLNYLSDPDFDPGGAESIAPLDDEETLLVRVNEGDPLAYPLALDGERRAVVVELPPLVVAEGQPVRISLERGAGGPIRAGTSLLVNEQWDDLLPANVDGRNAYGAYYTEVTGGQRPVVHPDNPQKREEMIAWIDEADYIMLSSQRAMWNQPRIPATFPMMMKYYESLFNGELGFELVAQFHENTWLGPLYISDTTGQIGWGERPNIGWPPPNELAAEEAFSVYDHPPVWIFRKAERYDPANTRALLESVDLDLAVFQNPLEATRAKGGLMLSAADAAAQRAGGTFREVFNLDGALSQRPWLAAVFWMATLTLLGWAAFPLAFIALRGLPDRGYALSRILGLLVVSWLACMSASVGLLPFTQGALVLASFALLAVGALLFARHQREMTEFIRGRLGYFALVELLAVGLFVLMAVIRLGNPDVWDVIWGGEKPMDLSYFTAVMRSTTFPPYDPWHAGGYINYYYYGFVFVGAITKLLGVVPEVAYNLALPMLFSMTGLGVFGVTWNVVAALEARNGGAQGARLSLMAGIKSRAAVAGFIAVALALLLGNLAQVRTVATAWYLTGSATLEETPLIGRAARTLDGGVKMLSGTPAPIYPGDWFWLASRAIGANPGEVQPITEFPYFTFLYGDLHAHMIAMPLQMLALGWAVGLVLAAGREKPMTRESWVLALGVGALAIGVLRPTNTWDWPTYLLLGSLALVYYAVRQRGLSLAAAAQAGAAVLALVGVSALMFLPYTANYGAAYSSVSLWPGSFTTAADYLFVHGLFLFFVVTHLARELRDWTTSWTEAGKARLEPFGWLIVLGAAALVGLCALLLLRGQWVGPIALPLLVTAGLLALRPGLPEARRVVLALMSAALGLTLMVEVIVLDGDIGRMNTVFKFYLQAWLLLSVACGAAAVWAWPAVQGAGRLRGAWKVALGVLVFVAALYPLTATPAKAAIRMSKEAPRTLDGAAFLDYVEYGDTDYMGNGITIRPGDDLGAIDWLRRNVEGTPVIMEAHGGNPYRSIAARIAMYTGLPNVIGWDWHQRQQRAVTAGTAVTKRIEEVNNFYNTLDAAEARNILRRYNVEYIVVGTLENAYYWPQGLAKFDEMIADGTLVEVFRDETARIFRVTNDE